MFSALANIYKIPELRQKVIFTLIMFAVFRLGTHIPVPGVDPSAIEQLFATGNLFGLLDLFSGGAFSKFSIFAMSITPYINASIIMQLLTVVIPTLEQWSKEGQEGHKKTTKVTRYLTVALAFFQAVGMSIGLKQAILNPSPVSILIIAITLTGGTIFLMWIGEQITANGVGNGISLIIFAGIVAALPKNLGTIYSYLQAGTISYFNAFVFAVIALLMIVFVIYIQEGNRRVPISYAKRVVGKKTYGGSSSHIPLKVNHAGVIPIIFASSVLMFPVTVAQFIEVPWVTTLAGYFAWGTPLQTSIYALLIIFFTYFYTAVTVKISDMAENLKKYGGFIPGIRPGKPTEEYLDTVMTRITLAGAFFLAFIAVLPNLVAGATHIEGVYFGGTALLIVVGVALNTMKQIESMVVMRHYQGFMK
ncbi:preprotein translocase subunit SecY [Selenomonas sputigena]|uniref:Protein translocase subunit SecY n=1 Tax=Selenomonas sputigena (strain ATCC 35185 / DSM 20758 / CCUG 44933 / VPI D19B-28) TaxID=546271 RepID=C9LTE9_SELS3|nr:preprotein translocase subunit SecY [Selenomonas sputigena]AEC00427.1 preprotein translocase, SecY subunit [Selenomonas sputigena ATCC 35185]EEX77995.1 preprotein translocase, SecY subunit [Selenomonas sputigena ATCC 35185]